MLGRSALVATIRRRKEEERTIRRETIHVREEKIIIEGIQRRLILGPAQPPLHRHQDKNQDFLPRPTTMIKVPGKKPGNAAFLYNGHAYSHDIRGSGKIYRCVSRNAQRKCHGQVRVEYDGTITEEKGHNHAPEADLTDRRAMTQQMIELCGDLSLDPKDIFDNVCRENQVVGKHLSFSAIKQKMDKIRKQLRPQFPASLQELQTVLRNYEPFRSVHTCLLKTADNNFGLMFSSPGLLEMLGNTDRLFIDSTINVQVGEHIQGRMHLSVIYVQKKKVNIAGAFILSDLVELELMETMWKKLFEEVPMIRTNVKSVISDYGAAAMGAVRSRFPMAHSHGSWFYYRQHLLRKWRDLGLITCDKEILWMAISLPLAPEDQFEEGLTLIEAKAKNVNREFSHNVCEFVKYLRNTWAPVAEKIGLHSGIVQTDNIVERMHTSIKSVLGGEYTDGWKFIQKLTKILHREESDLQKIKKNLLVNRVTPRNVSNRVARIKGKQHDLACGREPLNNFLRAFNKVHADDTYDELHNSKISSSSPTGNDVDGSLFQIIPEEDDDFHRENLDEDEISLDNSDTSPKESRATSPTSHSKSSSDASAARGEDAAVGEEGTDEESIDGNSAGGPSDESEDSEKSQETDSSNDKFANEAQAARCQQSEKRPPSIRERRLPIRYRRSIQKNSGALNSSTEDNASQHPRQRGAKITKRGRASRTRNVARGSRANRSGSMPTAASQSQGLSRGKVGHGVARGRRGTKRSVCRRTISRVQNVTAGSQSNLADIEATTSITSPRCCENKEVVTTSSTHQDTFAEETAATDLASAFRDVSLEGKHCK